MRECDQNRIKRVAGGCVVEWIHFAQDRDRWRAFVYTIMNPRFLAPWNLLLTYRFNATLQCLKCSCLRNVTTQAEKVMVLEALIF
jgi:hypothetical protein